MEDPQHRLGFGVVSLWESVIKAGLVPKGFQVQPSLLRRTLLNGGFLEVPIESAHVLAVARHPAPVRHVSSF